ncbi:hypothetical protein CTheo_7211 [Ceratobasidium theobromae]|uniref:Uncharacterized protein n=1 Tax=Ceratobasidium theobromae TaxID=1582974 RepID=A0A5N5QDE3_9AGAM|nr:hypothetical protein CTheo_7211 [Ceratobasidium theobromae]
MTSALPEPVTGDAGELAARQDPSNGDGGPAPDDVAGGATAANPTGAAVAICIAALQGTSAIGTTGIGGAAARGDTPATGAPISKPRLERTGVVAVWTGRFIAAYPFST